MKTARVILKILAALAVVAGAVYVIATYGDKIVAWSKKLIKCGREKIEEFCDCGCCCDEDCICEEDCCCGEDCCCEEPAAEDADFEA